MRHNNTWTIVRKEFARFFGDRQMFFTTVIMPGLLIYIVYSLMGTGIGNMVNEGRGEVVTLSVENMPQSLAPAIYQMDSATAVVQGTIFQADIDALSDKEINAVLVRFPEGFDSLIAAYSPRRQPPRPQCRDLLQFDQQRRLARLHRPAGGAHHL